MTFQFLPDQLTVARPEPTGHPGRAVRQLRIEARKAADFGKPLAAALMESLARVLPRSGPVFVCIEHWPGDLASDGVIFRLNAGLHALALSEQAEGLAGLYRDGLLLPPALLDRTLAQALSCHAEALLGWLAHPTQTNEVARVAGLVAALLELGRERAMPCEVLELGASAGLNLNFPRYAVRLGAVAACAPESEVMLSPEWRGRWAAAGELAITSVRGVDLHPLDVALPADRESLRAYIWPGEAGRAQRLEAAIGIARRHPPIVEADRASAWLAAQLAAAQPAGTRRVVFHSMVLQYADASERAAIDAAFAAAGARATADSPLARIGIEWRGDRGAVEIRITRWEGGADDGESHIAAHCHPYGEWIDWRGLA